MGVVVNIKADFKGVDVNMIDQYIQTLVREMTGEAVGRVVYHGVVKQDVDKLREIMSSKA